MPVGAASREPAVSKGRLRKDLAVRRQSDAGQVHHPEVRRSPTVLRVRLAGGPADAPVGRFGGPLGFDGRFAVGGRMPYGPGAARGAWSADGASFVLQVQTLGNDDVARVTHVFGDKTLELSFEWQAGSRRRRRDGSTTEDGRPKPANSRTDRAKLT